MNTQISKTFCIHHQADIDIISHCKMELLLMAKNKHRGIILIESQDISSILIIPRNLRDNVNVELICSFPPCSINWTNYKGESVNPNDKDKDKLHGWSTSWNNETQIEEIISPEHDGRWDLPRSSTSPLNKYTVSMLLFHNH